MLVKFQWGTFLRDRQQENLTRFVELELVLPSWHTAKPERCFLYTIGLLYCYRKPSYHLVLAVNDLTLWFIENKQVANSYMKRGMGSSPSEWWFIDYWKRKNCMLLNKLLKVSNRRIRKMWSLISNFVKKNYTSWPIHGVWTPVATTGEVKT
jgi:hypothetical protein